MSIEDKYSKIIGLLESMSPAQEIKGRTWAIFKYALDAVSAYGITIPQLRKIARDMGRDHELSQRLWSAGIRETRILATMIDDPDMVTEAQMEKWVSNFFYWEICDQCCTNLFSKTKYAYKKSLEWSSREEEYVKRAAFMLMASLATGRKRTDVGTLEKYLTVIEREAIDNRRFVKTAINQALREIGKRSSSLKKMAIETAVRLRGSNSRSARWIGNKVLRELDRR